MLYFLFRIFVKCCRGDDYFYPCYAHHGDMVSEKGLRLSFVVSSPRLPNKAKYFTSSASNNNKMSYDYMDEPTQSLLTSG